MRSLLLILLAGAAAQMPGQAGPAAPNMRPMARIVEMLKKMGQEMVHEQESDDKMHSKYQCWCDETKKKKANELANNKRAAENARVENQKQSAVAAKLDTQIGHHQSDLKETKENLATAIKKRDGARAEFNEQQKNDLQTITSLKNAIAVLKKHQSFIQKDEEQALRNVALLTQFRAHQRKYAMSGEQKGALNELIQGKASASATDMIFGMMTNMLENLEADDAANTMNEEQAEKDHAELVANMKGEIGDLENSIATKQEQMADAESEAASQGAEFESLSQTIAADEDFVEATVSKCEANHEAYVQRTNDRADEINAVNKAIEILSNDEASAQFEKSVSQSPPPASFVQLESRRQEAYAVLMKSENPAISQLALRVKLDAMTKLVDMMQQMILKLKEQQTIEVEENDTCVKQLQDNANDTQDTTHLKNREDNKVEKNNAEIKMLTDEMADLTQQLADDRKSLKETGENRERDNSEFAQEVAGQRNTQAILGKAIKVLADVFEKDAGNRALLAATRTVMNKFAGVQQPAEFSERKSQEGGSNKVLELLRGEQNKAKRVENDIIAAEEQDQADYEEFTVKMNKALMKKDAAWNKKNDAKAQAEGKLAAATQASNNAGDDLDVLGDTNSKIHKKCDFLLKNFDARQKARNQEMESLRQAKSILKGSSAGSFLQRK